MNRYLLSTIIASAAFIFTHPVSAAERVSKQSLVYSPSASNGPKMTEVKGRTGSKRVGGSGRSGKGGKYVGGRK